MSGSVGKYFVSCVARIWVKIQINFGRHIKKSWGEGGYGFFSNDCLLLFLPHEETNMYYLNIVIIRGNATTRSAETYQSGKQLFFYINCSHLWRIILFISYIICLCPILTCSFSRANLSPPDHYYFKELKGVCRRLAELHFTKTTTIFLLYLR